MSKQELISELNEYETRLVNAKHAYSMYPDKDNKQLVDYWKSKINEVKAQIGGDCESCE